MPVRFSRLQHVVLPAGVFLFVFLLSILAVFNQVKAKGLAWQEEHYLPVLDSITQHSAPWPMQSRMLSAHLTMMVCDAFEGLGVPRPIGSAFVAIRILQNVVLFLLALQFYRRLGIPAYAGLLGISAAAWGMTLCAHEYFLSMDVYTELILLLCAAWALCVNRPGWILPLSVLAFFNRETGLFLPLLWMAAYRYDLTGPLRLRPIIRAVLPFIVYLAGFRLLMSCMEDRAWVQEIISAPWPNAVGVLSILPLMALVSFLRWPPVLRTLALGILPLWIFIHSSTGDIFSTSALLAPQLLIFIPGALLCLVQWAGEEVTSTRLKIANDTNLTKKIKPSEKPGADASELAHAQSPYLMGRSQHGRARRVCPCFFAHGGLTSASFESVGVFQLNCIGAVVGCAVILSFFTVYYQMQFMGLEWYETVQWGRTQQVILGASGTPWQYRLFTEGIVYGAVHLLESLGVPRPVGTAFILVRFLQNTLAFSLAVWFYRKLGLSLAQGLWGVALLAYGMCHGLYDGDLTFNTYTDISLFLTAGLLILYNKPLGLIPLMLIAPFNRETSGCIPFMLLFAYWPGIKSSLSNGGVSWRNICVIAALCLGFWVMIVGGLRLVYGVRPYIVPTAGKSPIIPLLMFNLTWWRTWVFLFATLGLMPLLAIASWRGWPIPLQRFFWAVVPVWFPIHFSLAHAPETRLFLVPQTLIFIPGALCGLMFWTAKSSEVRAPGQSPP